MTALASLDILAAVSLRTWLKTLRRPVVLTFSFAQPLIWMLFFGFLFQRFAGEVGGNSYTSFLVPGVCAMTVLFGASQSGIALIRDMHTNFLARMLSTPADRRLVLGGKLAADVIRLLVQAIIVILLGVIVGARLDASAAAFLTSLVALGLFAAAFSALSCFIALRTRAAESMAAYVHVVNMPILFTSSALVPRDHMPGLLKAISAGNPLTWAVDALRAALLFGEMPSPTLSLLPLFGLSVVLFLMASAAMRGAARD